MNTRRFFLFPYRTSFKLIFYQPLLKALIIGTRSDVKAKKCLKYHEELSLLRLRGKNIEFGEIRFSLSLSLCLGFLNGMFFALRKGWHGPKMESQVGDSNNSQIMKSWGAGTYRSQTFARLVHLSLSLHQ